MDFLWDKITEWLKEVLISGISSNLSGMFDATNQKVAEISGQVGLTPQAWNGSIFNMVKRFLLNALCLKAVSVPRKKAAGRGMLMKNTHGLGGLHVVKVEIGS